MQKEKFKGSCLCGKVSLDISLANKNFGACHCNMCRKWCGSPFLAIECGPKVSISGEEYISIYSSSEWAERGFCKNCGSNLFYRLKDHSMYGVSSQIFNQSDLHFEHEIFIDEKPPYYDFSNATKKMTGKEFFAAFGASSDEDLKKFFGLEECSTTQT